MNTQLLICAMIVGKARNDIFMNKIQAQAKLKQYLKAHFINFEEDLDNGVPVTLCFSSDMIMCQTRRLKPVFGFMKRRWK